MYLKVIKAVLSRDLYDVSRSGELTASMIHFAMIGLPLAVHIYSKLV